MKKTIDRGQPLSKLVPADRLAHVSGGGGGAVGGEQKPYYEIQAPRDVHS